MLQTNPAASLHCVGHSLGAHTCGFAGKSLAKLGLGLERISALDPAGPLFLKTFFRGGVNTEDDAAARLTASDADFVSAIHTDAMFYGSRVAVGHVDMYPGHAGRWGTGQSGYKSILSISLVIFPNVSHISDLTWLTMWWAEATTWPSPCTRPRSTTGGAPCAAHDGCHV